ncbi:TPA: alpha/beta hydrolase [Klebsiella oxytoca]|nr:alpha/beta hydrolase [Klebsiella oxytoca]
MDIVISDRLIANTPVLWFRPADGSVSRRPLIVLFHRFMASRELDANLGYILAKAGYSVVCPQAALHGVKDNATLRAASFWPILLDTLEKFPALLAACQQEKLGDISRLGVMGSSMGGFAVLGAMARYPAIQAGAAYMASGYFADAILTIHPPSGETVADYLRGLAPYNLAGKEAVLAQRPLFLWHGEQDTIVDVRYTERLREAINSDSLTCIIDPQAGHKITQLSVEEGLLFFRQSLPV